MWGKGPLGYYIRPFPCPGCPKTTQPLVTVSWCHLLLQLPLAVTGHYVLEGSRTDSSQAPPQGRPGLCKPEPSTPLHFPGTYSHDTVCADCLTGTFSLGGTQEECLPWAKCGTFQQEVKHGTSSTDTTCSVHAVYVVVVIVGVVIVGVGAAVFFCKQRRRHTSPVASELEAFQREQQEDTIRFPVIEVGPPVTEEEAAFNCMNSG